MNFLVVFLALAVERFFPNLSEYRQLQWLWRYAQWLHRRLGKTAWFGGVGAVAMLWGVPTGMLAWVQWYGLGRDSEFMYFLFSLLVLIWSLGPRNLGALVNHLIEARAHHDDDEARQLLSVLVGEQPWTSHSDSDRRVVETVLVDSCDWLFAILFWYVLLGPVGAAGYRLLWELLQHPSRLAAWPDAWRHVERFYTAALALPARWLVFCYAVTGDFVGALHGWRQWRHTDDAAPGYQRLRRLLRAGGFGALNMREDQAFSTYDIDSALGLIRRAILFYLVTMGLLTFLGWGM